MYELFNLKDTNNLDNSYKLLYVSPFKFERDWNGIRHSHECTELFFCINGQGNFKIRDTLLTVESYDFVIVNPAVEHAEASTAAAPLEYIVLGISGLTLHLNDISSGYYKGTFHSQSNLLLPLLNALISELAERKSNYTYITSMIVNILLLYLNRTAGFTLESVAAAPPEPADRNIAWVKQYLDGNFTKEVNLDDLASKIGLNKFSIIRSFKKAYGTSPIDYLLEKRFEEAKFLLQTTENTIKQIAEGLGFCSANYFTQSFQKREGIAPTVYREQCLRIKT